MKKLLIVLLTWTSLSLCEELTTINTTIKQSDFESFKTAFENQKDNLNDRDVANMIHLAKLTTQLCKDTTKELFRPTFLATLGSTAIYYAYDKLTKITIDGKINQKKAYEYRQGNGTLLFNFFLNP